MAKSKINKKKIAKDPDVQEFVEVEIEFICPKRGKIKQKVKMKRLRTIAIENVKQTESRDSIDKLDKEDDGLSIYSDGEE